MNKYILLIIITFSTLPLLLNGQCTDNGNYWNDSWISCNERFSPNYSRGYSHWILYEFDTNQGIGGSHVWNANQLGYSGWGAKEVIIDYSTNGYTWIELGTFQFPKADESDTYAGFTGPDFGGVSVKKILVTIVSTHEGSSCVSLAEMRFAVDTTVCIGTPDVCDVCNGPGELTWFLDRDLDGLGDPNTTILACEKPYGYVDNDLDECDDGFLGWSDVAVLFENSGCTGCHGGLSGGASGLSLTSYEGFSNGGDICGPEILTGSTLLDIVTIKNYEACGYEIPAPQMNSRAMTPLTQTEMDMIQKWIDGGAPESCKDYVEKNVAISVKAILQGPFQSDISKMRTELASQSMIPLEQPYNTTPYNYAGTESLSNTHSQTVDWLLLEIRDGIDPTQVLQTRAVVLLSNGTIVGTNYSNILNFPIADGNYHVSLRHRNHLGMMTKNPVYLSNNGSAQLIDFTNPVTQTWGNNAQIQLANGKMAMWAGDTNGDKKIIFQGPANEPNAIFLTILSDDSNSNININYISEYYCNEDLDLNGKVIFQGVGNEGNVSFFSVIQHPNNSGININYIIEEQIP